MQTRWIGKGFQRIAAFFWTMPMVKKFKNRINGGTECDIGTTGKCFLGYKYSSIHPVQTMRTKKIWNILNGTYDKFMPLYSDGACSFSIRNGEKPESVNQMLYLGDSLDNWNEMLGKEMTKDMHLIHPFHTLRNLCTPLQKLCVFT